MSWYSTLFLNLYSNICEKDSDTYCAAFHTSLVYEATSLAIAENPHVLRSVVHSLSRPLQICSLGSRPGTDIIGVLAAMHDKFGFFPSHAELVDLMSEWKETFQLVVNELRSRSYGTLSGSVSRERLSWSFQAADLKNEINGKLKASIRKADLITVSKFVSATASQDTSKMMERIFDVIKPGALVLSVDNGAGGFQEMVFDAAEKYHLEPVFGPLTHELNKSFCNDEFGYESCYKTKVAVQLLSKLGVVKNEKEVCLPKKLPSLENLNYSPTSTSDPQNEHQAKDKPLPEVGYESCYKTKVAVQLLPKLGVVKNEKEVCLPKKLPSLENLNYSPTSTSDPQNEHPAKDKPLPEAQIANSRFDRDSPCDGLSSNQSLLSRFHVPFRSSRGIRSCRVELHHKPQGPLLPLPFPHPNELMHPGWPSRPLGVSQTCQANWAYKHGGSINYGNREDSGIYDCEKSRISVAYEGAQISDAPQTYESYDNSQMCGSCEETQTSGSYEHLRVKKVAKRPLLKRALLKTPQFCEETETNGSYERLGAQKAFKKPLLNAALLKTPQPCEGTETNGSCERLGAQKATKRPLLKAALLETPQPCEETNGSCERLGAQKAFKRPLLNAALLKTPQPCKGTETNGSYERLGAQKAFKRPLLNVALLKTPQPCEGMETNGSYERLGAQKATKRPLLKAALLETPQPCEETNGSCERLGGQKAFKRPLLKMPLLKSPHFA